MHDLIPPHVSTTLEMLGLNPETSTARLCALIADRLRGGGDAAGLLATLASKTGVPLEELEEMGRQVAHHLSLQAASGADLLALDTLERDFAFGVTVRTLGDGALLHHAKTHWAPLGAQALRSALRVTAQREPGRYGTPGTSVPAALAAIRDLAPSGDDLVRARPAPVVNVQNAELWIGPKGEVTRRAHRPSSRLRYCLPVTCAPDAGCPKFDAMLAAIFAPAEDPQAVIDHLLELMGYAIQGVRDIPVILILWGGGANGKSTLLTILQALIGEDQVWAGSLGAFSSDRFVLPNLADKLLFVEDDAKDGGRLNDGLLKSIAENKRIDTRRVRSTHGMSFCSTVMPIIAINGAPLLEDNSLGMRRRLQVIPFERRFTAEEIDPTLAKTIIREELPGVLNRLLKGLTRLRARGRFDPPAACEAAKARFLSASNPLHAFLDERCVTVVGKTTRITDLWQAFQAWCKAQGQRTPFPMRSLRTRMQALGYVVRKSNVVIVDDLALTAEGG